MKIEEKYLSRIMYSLVASSVAISFYAVMRDSKNYKGVEDLKQEIHNKDSKRYDSLMNDGIHRYSFIDWQYEVNKMNDSLRTVGIAKKAYFEGAQMVRDSIKNTERIK